MSPSSDHEQIDVSHVSIILASFFRKIGTVLNELSSGSFTRDFFLSPLLNGDGDGRFDIIVFVLWDASARRSGRVGGRRR